MKFLTDLIDVGTLVPDNATNGEVIQALFPKAKIFENESKTEYRYVDVFLCSEHDMNCFTKEWWNAPYRADKEAEENEI